MASTFAGLSLFNSGPHRFSMARVGRLVRAPFDTALELPFTFDEGRAIELKIVQTGRLVAATSADLWVLIEAIRTEAENKRTGTLIDHHGKQWTTMSMMHFDPAVRIDRGRQVSMTYRVSYLRFGS